MEVMSTTARPLSTICSMFLYSMVWGVPSGPMYSITPEPGVLPGLTTAWSRREMSSTSVPAPPSTVSLPPPAMMVSLPLPPWMLSLPAPPFKESSPLPPSSVSLPLPPSRVSLPLPPSSLSLPLPPLKESSPLPPSRVSLPLPPSSVSLPSPPLKLSLPLPPERLSLPLPPSKVSLPSPPSMVSLPLPPSILLSSLSPSILSLPSLPLVLALLGSLVVAVLPAASRALAVMVSPTTALVGVRLHRPLAPTVALPTMLLLASRTVTTAPGSPVPLMALVVPARPAWVMSTLVRVSMVKGSPGVVVATPFCVVMIWGE